MNVLKRSLVALAVAAAVGTGTAQAQVSDNVHKIAHWLPVTEEMLEELKDGHPVT